MSIGYIRYGERERDLSDKPIETMKYIKERL